MKAKPTGPRSKVKYRNLVARDGVIDYRHKEAGKSTRVTLGTDDWDDAAPTRVDWLAMARRPDAHYRLFSEAADEYLKVAKRHLAACTYDDTHGLLKHGGIVSRHFDGVFVEIIGDEHNTERVHTVLRDSPNGRAFEARPSADAKVVGLQRLGGLHHRYVWKAAA